jgi:hypothetical protein
MTCPALPRFGFQNKELAKRQYKKMKNYEISTGVSGVSGGSHGNKPGDLLSV